MDNNENNPIKDVENTTENEAANISSPEMSSDTMAEGNFSDVANIIANLVFDHQLMGMYDNMVNIMSAHLLPEVLDTPEVDPPSTGSSSTDSSSSTTEQKQVQEHQDIKQPTESTDKDKDVNLKGN